MSLRNSWRASNFSNVLFVKLGVVLLHLFLSYVQFISLLCKDVSMTYYKAGIIQGNWYISEET